MRIKCFYIFIQLLKVLLSYCRSEKSPRANIRIENVINFLTFEVFKYTCRGLYETHKFLFTLLLTIKIDLAKKKITHEEFGILIKGDIFLYNRYVFLLSNILILTNFISLVLFNLSYSSYYDINRKKN